MICPRRVESPYGLMKEGEDQWRRHPGDQHDSCSYCGSMHPDRFMELAEAGMELVPTDKNYKVYVDSERSKFYFQHLSPEQRRRFVDLLNQKKLKIGYPGHFYVTPFFIRIGPRTATDV